MAINLATKYADKIANMYTLGSLVADKASKEWDFSGVKSVKIYTPQTVEPVDYSRSGTNRYGTPSEMADVVQELSMRQDKSFSLIIDKGNNNEQAMAKNAGKMLKLQTDERMVPMVDKYALAQFVKCAGTVKGMAKPTKTTIISAISDAAQALDDARVPQSDRYLYLSGEMYGLVRTSGEFLGLESLGEKALAKGIVGEIFGAQIVKVPTDYLPKNTFFVLTHKNAVLVPYKIRDAKLHQDPPGISGALLEGRSNFDAFVVGARCGGVYAAVLEGEVTALPEITRSGERAEITCTTAGAEIYYTTDGTDPRYSDTAVKYAEGFTAAADAKVKAYAILTDGFASAVVEA